MDSNGIHDDDHVFPLHSVLASTKGKLNLKCLFGALTFFQKTNKNTLLTNVKYIA